MTGSPTPPTLLIDVGSSVIKICLATGSERLGPLERIPRDADRIPADQVRALLADRRRAAGRETGLEPALRICSSANGGVRVGVVGLSARYSVDAAVQSVVAAGDNVVYARAAAGPPDPAAPAGEPAVDVLVLVGGVDGGDHRHLRSALAGLDLARYPHEVLVWAGARDGLTSDSDSAARLVADYRTGNVLDARLRPAGEPLAATLRQIYLRDLIDRKGLHGLPDLATAPIWPTPTVVALAAQHLASGRPGPGLPSTPFLIFDVGGATTDVHYCTELRGPGAAKPATAASVTRQVFTDLGVASSRHSLLQRISRDPYLQELVDAIAPPDPRRLYQRIREGDAEALAAPVGFLACLFSALRELSDPRGPDRLRLGRAATLQITGGAWTEAALPAVRRVATAAFAEAGRAEPAHSAAENRWNLLVDRDYHLWARGLAMVPSEGEPAVEPPGPRTSCAGPGTADILTGSPTAYAGATGTG